MSNIDYAGKYGRPGRPFPGGRGAGGNGIAGKFGDFNPGKNVGGPGKRPKFPNSSVNSKTKEENNDISENGQTPTSESDGVDSDSASADKESESSDDSDDTTNADAAPAKKSPNLEPSPSVESPSVDAGFENADTAEKRGGVPDMFWVDSRGERDSGI